MNDTKQSNEHIYQLEITENQAKLLSWTCDTMSRLIEGQDSAYQDLFEAAWEKRCKKATGKSMDDTWDGGWHNMRHEANELCKQIKKKFWGLDWCTLNGIHYDDNSDVLWDIHQVIRHQLWLDRPDDKKSFITVDSSKAMKVGKEPLITIKRI